MEPRKLSLRPGEYLFKQGDARGHLYIVVRGRLKVLKKARGKDREVAEIGDNQIVGEMSFLDGGKRSASVMAAESTELIELDVKLLKEYLDSQPSWLRVIIESLVAKIRATTENFARHQ